MELAPANLTWSSAFSADSASRACVCVCVYWGGGEGGRKILVVCGREGGREGYTCVFVSKVCAYVTVEY